MIAAHRRSPSLVGSALMKKKHSLFYFHYSIQYLSKKKRKENFMDEMSRLYIANKEILNIQRNEFRLTLDPRQEAIRQVVTHVTLRKISFLEVFC